MLISERRIVRARIRAGAIFYTIAAAAALFAAYFTWRVGDQLIAAISLIVAALLIVLATMTFRRLRNH